MPDVTIKSFTHYIEEIFRSDTSNTVYRGERLSSRTVNPKVGRLKTVDGKDFTMAIEKIYCDHFQSVLKC